MPIKDYEDVTVYGLDEAEERALIEGQNECSFVWVTGDGSPMAVVMSYLQTPDGHFWMTASGQRKRIAAIRRDPRVAIVISSAGINRTSPCTVTYKGTAVLHDNADTKSWFYPALAERIGSRAGAQGVAEFAKMLDSPRRVIIEITPGLRVGYDGAKMRKATDEARDAGAI